MGRPVCPFADPLCAWPLRPNNMAWLILAALLSLFRFPSPPLNAFRLLTLLTRLARLWHLFLGLQSVCPSGGREGGG